MPTIPNFPQNLLNEHANWHMNVGDPAHGGRSIPAGQPGSGLEFLTFHRNFVAHFHAWYDTQPGADQAAVAPWTAVPPDLKVPQTGWTPGGSIDNQEKRIENNNPPFSSADELGIYIENGIHNNWLHWATATVYNEPEVNDPMKAPRHTYFYKIHGLVDNWWKHWQQLQKQPTKDLADTKHLHKEIVKEVKDKDHKEVKDKEIKEKDIKDLHKEVKEKEHKELIKEVKEHQKEVKEKEHKELVKEIKETDGKQIVKDHPDKPIKEKDKEKDIFEGGGGHGGDPGPLLNHLVQRVNDLENRVAQGRSFIQPEERPDVGGEAIRGAAKKGARKRGARKG